ncbi:MAG: hypothetical protein HKL80_11960 [Acidimicrobiales bacterium]|nr:hypothetical protein [Acidimicrobiales bacterium]
MKKNSLAFALVIMAIIMAACGGTTPSIVTSTTKPITLTPVNILPLPQNTLAEAAPLFNGGIWILSGTNNAKSISEYDVTSQSVVNKVPVSSNSQSLATVSGEYLALGTATTKFSGALYIYDGITGALTHTIPMPGSVSSISSSQELNIIYALVNVPNARSIVSIDLTTFKVQNSFPVASNAISISIGVDPKTMFVLQGDGTVDSISSSNGTISSQLKAGDTGTSLALSGNLLNLLVLKCALSICNIAVVNTSTDQVEAALPAPQGCVAIQFSPGGTFLYDVVSYLAASNLQVFDVHKYVS